MWSNRYLHTFTLVLVSLFVTDVVEADQKKPVDFERHVAPLLGRLGCNAAACHGAFGGKGGLQFSLFGYSAEMDYEALLDQIDEEEPDESPLLLKPSGKESHKGGTKFAVDSETYTVIKRWIESGASRKPGTGEVATLHVTPNQIAFEDFQDLDSESRQLKVFAEFADGTREDVTHLSKFSSRDEGVASVSAEGVVQPLRNGDTSIVVSYSNQFSALGVLVPFPKTDSLKYSKNNDVDRFINDKLGTLNIPQSRRASDEEFLRRVTLDTIGTLPTPDEVVKFCNDESASKREQKIDELLSHPMHAALWASRMCEITKCDVDLMNPNVAVQTKLGQHWHGWFRKRFQQNAPYDQIVRSILTATSRGQQTAKDWIQLEAKSIRAPLDAWDTSYTDRPEFDLYWRRTDANGSFPLEDMAELTAAAFTGIRINCARCHKHPFDRWSQDEYASFANIFSQVVYGSSTELNVAIFDELDRRRELKKLGKNIDTLPQIREVYLDELFGRRMNGSSADADVSAKPLGGEPLKEALDLREQFSEWLTSSDNPYFARNFANRVWSVYFGIGIVEPVDDFSISNPPSHPKLLSLLEKRFSESSFDIRDLEKFILMSAAYQRTSTPLEANRDDRRNFSRQYVRPLLAEVALDAVNKALGLEEVFEGIPSGTLAIEVGTNQVPGAANKALDIFGRGDRSSVCDCDRRTEPDMRQSLFLMNNDFILDKIKNGNIRELLKLENESLTTQLYLRILNREPAKRELDIAVNHLKSLDDREKAFDDLVWGLINTREFITNH